MSPQVEVTSLIQPLKDGYRALTAEWKNFFDIGLSEYLESQTEKYLFTNTFVHRSEKVNFYDIYYPIKACYNDYNSDFSDLGKIFSKFNNITLIGSAGSGKTTLIKYIFLETIKNYTTIPILIELRNLNEYDGNFEKLISEKILKSKIKPNDLIFKRTLESGKFLFLLDGYDEIFSEKKQDIKRQIELFVDSYPKNKFLITTRPGSGIETFPGFYDFSVLSLDDNDVHGFVGKIIEQEERKKRIISTAFDKKNEDYLEFLRNPLLLSMFIIAFENHPEIPKKKSAFYRNVFDTLYSRHDGITKNSFPREKTTGLQRDDFEEILSIFSYLTLLEGQYKFTREYLTDKLNLVKNSSKFNFSTENLIYDLRTSISILILDGFEFSFPHRSLQEYFTALFISRLPTDKKKKAYKNLSKILATSSADYSLNFWKLCFELDKLNFIQSFLIPKLKGFITSLDRLEGKKLVEKYLKLIDASFLISNWHGKNKEKLDFKIYRLSNFLVSFTEHFEIYDFENMWNFPQNTGFQDEYFSKYPEQMTNAPISKDLNDNILNLLVEYDFQSFVNDAIIQSKEKLENWEKEINEEKNNLETLLDI